LERDGKITLKARRDDERNEEREGERGKERKRQFNTVHVELQRHTITCEM
jgi:hypothetical protein